MNKQIFIDSLYDSVLDTLKVVPVLFLAYLLVAFLSHDHKRNFTRFLSKDKKTSVFYASLLGCVPQCGFSSVVADLFSRKAVSVGTLIAVFVATSDEAIPLMLSNPEKVDDLLILIAFKLVFAVFWGYLVDLSLKAFSRKKMQASATEHLHENQEDSSHASSHHHSCGHIHTEQCKNECGHSHGHCCSDNIFADAFDHTFEISIFIFVATFVINLIIGQFGLSALENLLTSNVLFQVIIASVIGLVPNCASSVLLVELFMHGSLAFPALVAGLTSGAGVGLVILCTRNAKKPLQNLAIISVQYLIGVASGMLLTLIF